MTANFRERTDDTPDLSLRSAVVRGPLWYVAAIASVAHLMVQFDNAVVSIALPTIQRDLALEISDLQWIINSYNLGFAALLLLSGRISDLVGRRQVFLAGLWVFTFGSVLGGFAQNDWQLIAARASHGISGAILLPSTLGLILAAYQERHQRNRAISIWGAASIIGGTAGAVLGGVLTQHWGWRSTLFFCLPIGCVLLVFSTRNLIRESVRRAKIYLDVPGAICVVGAVTAVVYATIGLEEHSWASVHTIGSFAAAVAFLVAFVLIESRSRDPLVPLGIFRSRSISMGNLVAFVVTTAIAAQVFLIVLYLQKVLGYKPQEAGLAELPAGVTTFVVAILAARLVRRTSARTVLIIGALIYTVGLVWISRVPVDGGYLSAVFFPLEVLSLGMGLIIPCLTIVATAGASKDSAGLVSGVATTTRQVGSAVGVSVFGSIATAVTLNASGSEEVAMAAGYRAGLLAAAAVTVIAALLALTLPKDRAQSLPEQPGF